MPLHRSTVPITVVGLALLVSGCLSSIQSTDSIDEIRIEVVGNDYRLRFRYPGKDGLLHTDDDRFGSRNLVVPKGAQVHLTLLSLDYAYLIEIPKAGVYDVLVPELRFETTFAAPECGRFQLLGSQMCSYAHAELLGEMMVQSPADFRDSMKRLSADPRI